MRAKVDRRNRKAPQLGKPEFEGHAAYLPSWPAYESGEKETTEHSAHKGQQGERPKNLANLDRRRSCIVLVLHTFSC